MKESRTSKPGFSGDTNISLTNPHSIKEKCNNISNEQVDTENPPEKITINVSS